MSEQVRLSVEESVEEPINLVAQLRKKWGLNYVSSLQSLQAEDLNSLMQNAQQSKEENEQARNLVVEGLAQADLSFGIIEQGASVGDLIPEMQAEACLALARKFFPPELAKSLEPGFEESRVEINLRHAEQVEGYLLEKNYTAKRQRAYNLAYATGGGLLMGATWYLCTKYGRGSASGMGGTGGTNNITINTPPPSVQETGLSITPPTQQEIGLSSEFLGEKGDFVVAYRTSRYLYKIMRKSVFDD
jgi:hypothetical protein